MSKIVNFLKEFKMSKEIKKALEAGYDTATPEHTGENVETVEANQPTMDSNKIEAKTEEVVEEVVEETKEETKEEVVEAKEEEKKEEVVEEKKEDKNSPEANGGKVSEIKFAGNLFKPFSLGSTLKKEAHGNVMTNVKKPAMDYEKVFKEIIRNEKLTDDDFKKE